MYHNTTHSTCGERRLFRSKAQTQETRIFQYMAAHPANHFTPSELCRLVFSFDPVPITSVRRALSDLTNDLKLEKTTKQRPGPFGRPEYCWRVPAGQLSLGF